MKRCPRCGIDTTHTPLCPDCRDVVTYAPPNPSRPLQHRFGPYAIKGLQRTPEYRKIAALRQKIANRDALDHLLARMVANARRLDAQPREDKEAA